MLTSPVSYRCVYLNVNEKYKDDISFDDGYGSRNGSLDDGESRGGMIVDDGTHEYIFLKKPDNFFPKYGRNWWR